MKLFFVVLFALLPAHAFTQSNAALENKLLAVFKKIKDSRTEANVSPDSVRAANELFKKELISVLQQQPELIRYPFEKLQQERLTILSSADGKLRVYNWDDNLGGTMRRFKSIVQLQSNPAKQSVFLWEDNGAHINKLYTINTPQGNSYLFSRTIVGSSALFIESIEIYKSGKNGLLVKAPLIKTPAGYNNLLRCEVDYSASVNKHMDPIDTKANYDPEKREITIPLILADGKITTRKIGYRFNGSVFEKIK